MDTPDEIRRDKYWQEHLYCCETCKYRRVSKFAEYCSNEDSPFFDDEVGEYDSCECYIER